jgi:DNA-binding CsgD family transcriptional regulator
MDDFQIRYFFKSGKSLSRYLAHAHEQGSLEDQQTALDIAKRSRAFFRQDILEKINLDRNSNPKKRISALTRREDVLAKQEAGQTIAQIASDLNISRNRVSQLLKMARYARESRQKIEATISSGRNGDGQAILHHDAIELLPDSHTLVYLIRETVSPFENPPLPPRDPTISNEDHWRAYQAEKDKAHAARPTFTIEMLIAYLNTRPNLTSLNGIGPKRVHQLETDLTNIGLTRSDDDIWTLRHRSKSS